MNRRLLFVVNEARFFLSHRLALAVAARADGYQVHVATRPGDGVAELLARGFSHHPLSMSRSGRNPLAELRSIFALFTLMRRLRPALVHLVTIKPVLYGGIAARLAGVPGVVAAISGLGYVFAGRTRSARLLRPVAALLYRLALGQHALRVIFQNPSDRQALVGAGLVRADRTLLIPGSGVDLAEFAALPERPGPPQVVLAARLLRDKGVMEFVEAARLLRSQGLAACFAMAGIPDPGNPASVTEEDVAAWHAAGDVQILGFRADIATLFAQSHIVVLPSYHEGLPKVLIEAAACGRAVITTDVPGCRDAIEAGASGLLVPPRDANALAAAIRRLVEDAALRRSMGRAGRALAERRFSIDSVVQAHLGIYRSLCPDRCVGEPT